MPGRAVVFPCSTAVGAASVCAALYELGWDVSEVDDLASVLGRVERGACDLLAVAAVPGFNRPGISLAREVRERDRGCAVLLLSEASSEGFVIDALRAGVSDVLSHTATTAEIAASVRRVASASSDVPQQPLLDGTSLIGGSAAMRNVRLSIARAAPNDSNVLITGETGTGKELVADLIHRNSARARRPMICINSAAIPDTLLESELFGYERGAFTGAYAANPGKLEQAAGGTLFFDEIGEMTPYAQAKILRAIESREIHRLGGRRPIPIDVRIISATNRDVDALAMDDTFRKDLYFRINVMRIHLAPLRERKSDIQPLIDHYLRQFNRSLHADVRGLDGDTLDRLIAYDWPGNVRELRNVLENVFVSRPAQRISFLDLPDWLRRRLDPADAPPAPPQERDRILSALSATNWNKSKAAERLSWSRMTLYRKLAKYQLDHEV
jgi:DNA-binding NtrC family response regulator